MLATVTIEPRSPSTLFLLDHRGQGGLGHQERTGEVDPNHPIPLRAVEQMHRTAPGDAGGVEDTVQAIGHGGEHGGDSVFVAHVGRHEMEIGTQVGWGGQVGADDASAFCQQAPRGGQADARRRAGHDERARTCTINVDHGGFLRQRVCPAMVTYVVNTILLGHDS
jgi:hypothetical protein